MNADAFHTTDGNPVTAVTADDMRAVDRVAEEIGLALEMMMENAGRNLARAVRERTPATDGVVVLAGDGGNGGGGLACARHLANHGVEVSVVLDRPATELTGVTAAQHAILDAMDVPTTDQLASISDEQSTDDQVVVDALVGYGLAGPLGGRAAELVEAIPSSSTIVSLDVPTGRNATSGAEPGVAVDPDLVVTLALPKTGLAGLSCPVVLADISIPATVYERLDIPYDGAFDGQYLVDLVEG